MMCAADEPAKARPRLATISPGGTDDDRFPKYHESERLSALAFSTHRKGTVAMNTNPNLSRRSALAGLAGAAAAGFAPAFASARGAASAVASPLALAIPAPEAPAALQTNDDAELFNLLKDHQSAAVEARRLYKAFEKFETKHFQRRCEQGKQMPEILRQQPEDLKLDLPKLLGDANFYEFREVNDLRGETWPLSTFVNEGDKSVFTSWTITPSPAARARADEIIGAFDKWERQYNRHPRGYGVAKRANDAAENRLWALERKIRDTRARSVPGLIAKARRGHELKDERFAASVAADLLALGGGQS
jgi:hypothetical protein